MLTELEIVNDMLAATGTAAVSTANTSHPAYKKAYNKLVKEARVMQGKGWWFNRSVRMYRPNVAGEVILPSTTLNADPTNTNLKYVVRGGKLYSMSSGSHVIGHEVEVDVIEFVPIADMPPTAQAYLQAHAVYMFYLDENGGEPKLSSYLRLVQDSRAAIMRDQLQNSDVNFFKGASYKSFARPQTMRRLLK
ncbi:hypothetical protein SAMN05216227_102045 [Pseudorhodobacter antarcticus]|uniref:Tail tubular protein A n=1 Tax=Pseudorhodobacter antarcticus TaxID=1077947 RepID=A0A1H8II66_9RHOB|nr:hypothetical protein [Pseudorhodobacter antarcticus]SEN67969.1 hypothetical protein SAMN05216227_102045 [Pseudorhodobacter antarcticus]